MSDDLFRPKRSDPPAVRLLKAIFGPDVEREAAEQSPKAEDDDGTKEK